MRYSRTATFKRTYQSLDPVRRNRVDKLKTLRRGIWEIRAGLGDRILFRRTGDIVELLIVGNHDEISRLVRQL